MDSDEQTVALVDAVHREGTCWCGPTQRMGRPAMRISISGWATSQADVIRSARAIIAEAKRLSGAR